MRHSKTAGILKYKQGGTTYFRVAIRFKDYFGMVQRYRERGFRTREQAEGAINRVRASALQPPRAKPTNLTVKDAWDGYRPISERDNDSHKGDCSLAAHLVRHIGDRQVSILDLQVIDAYRAARKHEPTKWRKRPPSPQQLDHEVGLLKRILNYAVACGRLELNPIEKVKLLRVPNTRDRLLGHDEFQRVLEASDPPYRPILAIAYDLGLRKREILDLTWGQLDLNAGCLVLEASDTKTEKARRVYMTARVKALLGQLRPGARGSPVFPNPETGKPWADLKKAWARALAKAGITGVWFHDMRRAALTNARREGVPETVVMKMSGHRTRSAFDRYNIIEDQDLQDAARLIEAGRVAKLNQAATNSDQATKDLSKGHESERTPSEPAAARLRP